MQWIRGSALDLQHRFHLAHEHRALLLGDTPHALLPGFDGVVLKSDAPSRGEIDSHVQFHQSLPQYFQGPAGSACRWLVASQALQARFTFTVKHPRALAPLKRRLQPFTDTALTNLFQRSTSAVYSFGNLPINQVATLFACIRRKRIWACRRRYAASRPRFTKSFPTVFAFRQSDGQCNASSIYSSIDG
jgi:hypothetical protein